MGVLSELVHLVQDNLLTCVMGVTVVILVLWIVSLNRASSPPLPPSPRFRLPILGHLLQLSKDLRIPLKKFRNQFGDVYSFYMGTRYTVVIGGYATIKEAFKGRSLFVDRPEMYMMDLNQRGKGIVWVSGHVWRDHRRFALSTLKDFGLGRNHIIKAKIQTETELLLKAIRDKGGRPFDPREFLMTATANIISSMAFGNTFKHGDAKFLKFIQSIGELSKALTSGGLATIMPFLAKLPGDPLNTKEVSRAADARFAFIREIIEEHMTSYDENVIEDYTSAFIKTMKQTQLKEESTSFTLDQLSGVISDLFIAGTDTTTIALVWSIVCLINFPKIQERMYDVIKEHVGTERLPTLEDRAVLSYIEAVYMESMRYCVVGIVDLPYTASSDVELNGYMIPKGSFILPDLYTALHDENVWGDPQNFRPDHFLNEDGSLHTPDEWIVFFLGKRRCLGEALARMEMFSFLAAMVQSFKFESPVDEPVTVETVDGQFGVAHEPKPFKIVAKSR